MMILLWAIPFFMITMLIEWRMTEKHNVIGYGLKDSAANISMGLGNLVVMYFAKVVTLAFFFALYELRFFEIPTDMWWAWLLLIPCDDFCFYWYHRLGHEVRLFWAAHVNHLSSQSYNQSTALRQTWTPTFTIARRRMRL